MKQSTKAGLDTWAHDGLLPGDFLEAVLRHDLMGAIFQADSENLRDMMEICSYVWNALPGTCHGSKALMDSWQDKDPGYRRGIAISCLKEWEAGSRP